MGKIRTINRKKAKVFKMTVDLKLVFHSLDLRVKGKAFNRIIKRLYRPSPLADSTAFVCALLQSGIEMRENYQSQIAYLEIFAGVLKTQFKRNETRN